MIEIEADIVVIGAGFSGSLISMLLQRIGLRPILIDRGSHPRFAIGESSTRDKPCLEDLPGALTCLGRSAANYVRWKRTYPQIVCGLTWLRYFHHQFDDSTGRNTPNGCLSPSVGDEDADTLVTIRLTSFWRRSGIAGHRI